MKKLILTLALVFLPLTSWQVWNRAANLLIVHETNDPNSAICYQGPVEDYDGTCVSPTAAPHQYREKQRSLR